MELHVPEVPDDLGPVSIEDLEDYQRALSLAKDTIKEEARRVVAELDVKLEQRNRDLLFLAAGMNPQQPAQIAVEGTPPPPQEGEVTTGV